MYYDDAMIDQVLKRRLVKTRCEIEELKLKLTENGNRYMKIKDDCGANSDDFWYDLRERYLKPEDMLESAEDAERVMEAVKVIQEFETACNDQIVGFIQ